MPRLSMRSTSKLLRRAVFCLTRRELRARRHSRRQVPLTSKVGGQAHGAAWRAIGWSLALAASTVLLGRGEAWAVERDPVILSVVAVNPSLEKTHKVPVRIDLPQEVTPTDVLDHGELLLEYDDDRSMYYVYLPEVTLAPRETRVFEVTIKDVWFVPEDELKSLRSYTGILLDKLKDSEFFESANQLAKTILQELTDIEQVQNDETLSRKARIGAYRAHLETLARIKEDLARMEKLLTFTGGPPVIEMLEESPLKSDAPSTTTTWLVIFLIVIFIGLLGGQFFFTWHRKTQSSQDLSIVQQSAFPPVGRRGGDGSSAPPGSRQAHDPSKLN